MGVFQDLKKCCIKKDGSFEELVSSYSKKLSGDGERKLFRATAELFRAYCASPAFSKSRQLDILTEGDNDIKILRILIRGYGQGVENILNTYDEYFNLEEKQDFWEFFNNKLNLPDDWIKKTKRETNPVGEVPYGTGLDDYGNTPDIYPDDFDDDLNKMLNEKGV